MSRNSGPVLNPLIPEPPLPTRLWIGLPFFALLASALSVTLIAAVHVLGGDSLLIIFDEFWGRLLGILYVIVPLVLAFILPPRPAWPGVGDEEQSVSPIAFRMITFLLWNVAVLATTTFLLRRFNEPLGLDTDVLLEGGFYLGHILSLFWTVVFFTTIFVLDARRREAPPT